MESSEFFESIPQTAVKVGPHNTFYPVFYRDTAYMSVFLLAPLDKVKSLLPSKRMHPFRLTPWHGMVTMSATQHKDSDIGPYNMVEIGVPFGASYSFNSGERGIARSFHSLVIPWGNLLAIALTHT